jgi:hypothetical protein
LPAELTQTPLPKSLAKMEERVNFRRAQRAAEHRHEIQIAPARPKVTERE